MAFYELGLPSVAAATVASYMSYHAATTRDAEFREFGAFCNAATASPFLLGRPANTPAASTSTLFNAVNPDSQVAALTNGDTAWSTAPTTPTVIFRRVALPATVAAGIVFVWNPGEGIMLSKNAGTTQWLIVWNFSGSTGSVLNTYAKVLE